MKKKDTATKQRKKHPIARRIALCLLIAAVAAGAIFARFGGFGTGDCADTGEFGKYARSIAEIDIPGQARIIALGEATHGNAQFQQLKLDVFRELVTERGVRAFGLEGDFGGCEAANRCIHGADITPREALEAIGFEIYMTDEMEQLISWMREYNKTAAPGDDLRFYGFDMQRIDYNYRYLLEAAGALELDTSALEALWDGDGYSDAHSPDERAAVIEKLRDELGDGGDAAGAHFADILLQNIEFAKVAYTADGSSVRDRMMAQNAMWILSQEEQRGSSAIFLTGHNGHMKQFGSYAADDKVMGNILADELGDAYYVIGTDFYKSDCSLPTGKDRRRVGHVFYSHDPLAKAAKKCGMDMCWLDFSAVPEDSPLRADITDYAWMGTLGDVQYNPLIYRLLPMSYRVWQSPAALYDGIILVTDAQEANYLPAED